MKPDLWDEAVQCLENNRPVAFATIITRSGSAPRGAGAKMLVDAAGLATGTVGGGRGEAQAVREAEKTLADGQPRLFTIDMTGSARDGADLICGGVIQIFTQRLEPSMLPTLVALRRHMRRGETACLLTPVVGSAIPLLITAETEGGLAAAVRERAGEGAMLLTHDGLEYALEPFPARTRLVLAGGGHVSLATARIARMVDFDITVIDDRSEFVQPARFPWLDPDRLLTVPEFVDCLDENRLGFPVTANTFVAILTRGHSFDSEVLAQALGTRAGYIGMIGSSRKRAAVYGQLLGQGFGQADLDRVHSPIGLGIGAETPEEIAVSIVAELIAVRRM